MSKVLFLCTANLYRSRFCEHWFNHLAPEACPAWTASSRALAVERHGGYRGAIYMGSVDVLTRLGVPLPTEHRRPAAATQADLDAADHVVAMKAGEHRALLEVQFGTWCSRHLDGVEFWDVADYGLMEERAAFAALEANVADLCRRLGTTASLL